jgi:hypothetical protein
MVQYERDNGFDNGKGGIGGVDFADDPTGTA